jgi:hypothetical protein
MSCLHTTIQIPIQPESKKELIKFTDISFNDFISTNARLFTNHLTASIISSAVRISPGISKEEFQDTLAKSVNKEISAAITISPQASFDFRAIFDDRLESRTIPFTDRMAPNPLVASDTYTIFCNARAFLANRIVLPSSGNKTVGKVVEQDFWHVYSSSACTFMHEGTTKTEVTTTDCMRLYLETGYYPRGPVEMRYAWTYNQLEPRVYYARGGDVVMSSQYIQTITNLLVDCFPETHRKDRFMPPKAPLNSEDVEIIYDYSSFTSKLEAVIPFVTELAHFFRGTYVSLVDTRKGLVLTDLGDLFDRYNTECNLYATFDASRVLGQTTGTTLLQHTCGMLGVEGNIFLATLLHGLHLRFIAGLQRSRCVGDDARYHHNTGDGRLSKNEKMYQHWVLSGCGELNPDKMGKFERDEDPDLQAFRYVKRPLRRDQDFMIEGILLTLPSIIAFGPLDSLHTYHPSSTHPARKAYAQILRFVQELYVYNLKYDEDDIVWKSILKHLMYMRRRCLRMDPDGQHSMYKSSDYLTHYRFPKPDSWGVMSVDEWIIDDFSYDEVVKFPSMWCREDEGTCDGRVGSVMIRQGSKARGLLEKLGYVEKVDLFDSVSMKDVGPEIFAKYVSGDYMSFSEYTVVKDVPVWWTYVPKAL